MMMIPLLWWALLMLLWFVFIIYELWKAVLGSSNYRTKPYFFRNDPIYGITGTLKVVAW